MLPSKYPKNNSARYSYVLHFTFKNMSKREKLFIQSSNYHLPNSEENMQLLFNGGQRAPASAKKPFYSPSFLPSGVTKQCLQETPHHSSMPVWDAMTVARSSDNSIMIAKEVDAHTIACTNLHNWGQRENSLIKTTSCSSMGLGFDSQNPHRISPLAVTPRELTLSSGLCGQKIYMHTCRQNKHTHKIFFKNIL